MISVKKYEESDREWLQGLLDKDEFHKANELTMADALAPGTTGIVIADETGPLMFVRCHTALRVGFQFDAEHSYRTAKVAREVVEWMKGVTAGIGATELIAVPGGKAVNFVEKLGFEDFNGKCIKVV